MKIAILDGATLNPGDNPWDALKQFGELLLYPRTAPELVVERARDAEIIVTNKTKLTADLLAKLPKLRFIAVTATGYNVVDIEAARARKIPVSNVPIYGTESVAQFTFALLLELCHHVGTHSLAVYAGEWSKSADFSFWKSPQQELSGLTFGVVGFGRIGRKVAELAHAFGMRVIASSAREAKAPTYESFAWRSARELFSEADVISLHCPLTAENAGFVNSEVLGVMKRSAFLINTARGGLVNERHLADALNAEKIAGAAVDVVSEEPIVKDNPLLSAKNCIITPHMAWSTVAARRRLMQTTADNIASFLSGRPVNIV